MRNKEGFPPQGSEGAGTAGSLVLDSSLQSYETMYFGFLFVFKPVNLYFYCRSLEKIMQTQFLINKTSSLHSVWNVHFYIELK